MCVLWALPSNGFIYISHSSYIFTITSQPPTTLTLSTGIQLDLVMEPIPDNINEPIAKNPKTLQITYQQST
jgi:hypothetical protein